MQPVGKQRRKRPAPEPCARVIINSSEAVIAQVPGQDGYVDHLLPLYQVIRDVAGRLTLPSDALPSKALPQL